MDWSRLAGPLMDAGLTILGSAIGGPAGGIATTIGREIARELGVGSPQEAARTIANDPQAVEKLRGYEAAHAEELALLGQEQRHMSEILAREDKGPWWQHAWRPAMMWLLGFLWLNQLFLVPVILNGMMARSIGIPPYDVLITLTGIYMALYMGGHTLKRAVGAR